MKNKLCKRCDTNKNVSDFYKRRTEYDTSPYCKKCMIAQAIERQREIKRLCVEYMGGKCQICGYDKCIAALEFHHLDPSKKEFGFGGLKSTRINEKILRELEKCLLLCSNCHRETHFKEHIIGIRNNPTEYEKIQLFDTKFCTKCGNDKLDENCACSNCRKDFLIRFGKKKKEKLEINTRNCPNCNGLMHKESVKCKECDRLLAQKIEWPNIDELISILKNEPYTTLAKKLGVSDNAIRKNLIYHGINPKTLEKF